MTKRGYRACLTTVIAVALAACASPEAQEEEEELADQDLSGSATLLVSANASRSSAHALNGATLSGKEYVFTSDTTGVAGLKGVTEARYWLDNPAMTGAPTRVEGIAPYDFAGTAADGTALPWDTSKLAKGTHTISETVKLTTGVIQKSTATFSVGVTSAPPPPPPSGKVKWHPGHYGASAGIAFPTDAISKFTPEMDDMLKDDWVVGYRLFITWAALDEGPVTFTSSVGGRTSGTLSSGGAVEDNTYWASFSDGEYRQVTVSGTAVSWTGALPAGAITTGHLYRTAFLDQILARLKTHYAKPKQLVIALLPMSFSGGSHKSGDYSRIPKYIATSSAYGPSPDSGSHGWWGPPVGDTDGAYSAALYRPAVANEYAALGRALGAKYDADPQFEAIMDQENSAVVGPAQNFPPRDGSYSDDLYVAQQKMFLTVWLKAFPHTSVVSENTFMHGADATQQFEAWMMANRIAPGTADVTGQSYYDAQPGRLLTNWGLAAYAGQTVDNSSYKGPDMRGSVRAMVDVEGPDIGNSVGTKISATPLDLVSSLNKTVKASHAFWCHVPAGRGSTPAPKWAEVTAVLKDHPLTSTGYPSNYP